MLSASLNKLFSLLLRSCDNQKWRQRAGSVQPVWRDLRPVWVSVGSHGPVWPVEHPHVLPVPSVRQHLGLLQHLRRVVRLGNLMDVDVCVCVCVCVKDRERERETEGGREGGKGRERERERERERLLDLTCLYQINVQARLLGTQFLTSARKYARERGLKSKETKQIQRNKRGL